MSIISYLMKKGKLFTGELNLDLKNDIFKVFNSHFLAAVLLQNHKWKSNAPRRMFFFAFQQKIENYINTSK